MRRLFRLMPFKRDPDRDVWEEIEAHLDMEKERLMRRGMGEAEAEREASARFGDRVRFEAQARRQARAHTRRSFFRHGIESVADDFRISFRRLRKTPGFTLAAVLILGVGIGGNSSLFSVLKEAILAEPPYPEPDRLVLPSISHVYPTYTYHGASYPELELIEEIPNRLVDPLAGYAVDPVTLSGLGDAERVDAEVVTPDYFRLLGASPLLGRTFSSAEGDRRTPQPVAVLSEGLWNSSFGRDPEILGRQILINGRSAIVVGVLPGAFHGVTGRARLWIPMAAAGVLLDAWRTTEQGAHWFSLLGRLRQGATRADAEAQLLPVAQEIRRRWPNHGTGGDLVPTVRPFRDVATNERVRTSLLLLSLAAGLVLLIACANVAGLVLARGNARTKETAVRLALGAGRWRVARQCLTECVLVGLLGGAVGLGLAIWGPNSLALLAPESQISGANELQFVDLGQIRVDAGAVLFTVALSIVAALLVGVLPAVKLSRTQLEEVKRPQGTTTRGGRRPRWGVDVQHLLVGGQVALALCLLIGAGLLMFSLARLQQVETGIRKENLLSFSYTMPRSAAQSTSPHITISDADAVDMMAFHESFLARLRSIPAVVTASMGCPPLGDMCGTSYVGAIEGRPELPESDRLNIGAVAVEGSYFETVGARLVSGRSFSPADRKGAPRVLVLNATAARTLFPNGSAVGQRLSMGHSVMPEGTFAEVVGVVDDILYGSPDAGPRPVAYLSSLQVPTARPTFLVRTADDPLSVLPAVRAALRGLNAQVPIYGVTTVKELGARSTGTTRLVTRVLSVFATFSTLLAVLGIYATIAYAVSLRDREVGIRMALGCQRDQAVLLFLRQGAVVAGLGVLFGLVAAWGFTRFLSSLLFQLGTLDPLTYGLAASLLFGAALLATYVPARRVTRVDPIEALRAE